MHCASHHSKVRTRIDGFALMNKYHVQMLAYLVGLLDHSVILYGSSMSNGNQHDHDPLPVVLVGGAAGGIKGGRHIVAAPHTPMSNLLLSVLEKLSLGQDSFGDSNGKIEI